MHGWMRSASRTAPIAARALRQSVTGPGRVCAQVAEFRRAGRALRGTGFWALSVGDNRWSDEWFRERDARALDAYLRECGVPGFAAEALSGMIRPDSA